MRPGQKVGHSKLSRNWCWVVDRLVTDLALQVRENQAGTGWKSDIPERGPDPWWDTKDPGV